MTPATRPAHGSDGARRRATPGRARRLAVAVAAVVVSGCSVGAGASTGDGPLLVAAAADLRPAFLELAEDFEAATGEEVTFIFGSSGQLAQQLIEGAPMDLYASANVTFVEQVLDEGVGDPATQATYALGRLTIWSRADRWGGWDGIEALAADDAVTTIAIANPEHAPYGLAAKQALESVWDAVEPKLVFGENIADTQRLAATGNADVAIVALSLALAADEAADDADGGGDAGGGQWVLLDDHLHAPLQQEMIVTAPDPARAELAQRFVDHVGSDAGRAVMRRFGLLLPGEDPPAVWDG